MQAPIEIPNFEMSKELGKGGMATVYLANQLQPKRKVAIKVVAPTHGQDNEFMESLKLEGDMAAQCNHNNIVTIYACGVIDEHYYLAMELLSGGDLAERIKHGVSTEQALEIIREMAEALDHAHKIKLLHRDIKPENIMFHENGKAVLVDFGIAKEQDTESNFTKAGAVVGTPHYMSPERATGKTIDGRSDLYALGVVFYEMLTGEKLYSGADTFAISYAHIYEPIPALPTRFAKYQSLLNKMVAKDADDRFQTAGDLVKALQAPSALPANDPSTNATMAVSAIEGASLPPRPQAQPSPQSAHTDAADSPGSTKLPWIPIVAVMTTVAIGVVLAMNFLGGKPTSRVSSGNNLTIEQRQEVQDLLAAATSFQRIGNHEQATDNLVKVLRDYDCTQEEARRGLKALSPDQAAEIIGECDGS